MSTSVKFCTICFYYEGQPINYSVLNFLKEIELMIKAKEKEKFVIREIDGKLIRFFPFYYSLNQHKVVIPFGKLKKSNKPYWINKENNSLEEIPMDLFDINSIAYDSDANILLFTTNREGPSYQKIEEYLNTFIPSDSQLSIEIKPIFINSGLEKVRKAQLVRSVTIDLDLGKPLNNFFVNQIDRHKPSSLAKGLQNIANHAQEDMDSKKLSIELGIGHGKKGDTLDLDSMLKLLEQINIEEDFVKEIKVTYKNGEQEKMDIAKLKNSTIELMHKLPISGSQIAPEYLLNNISLAIDSKKNLYRPFLRDHNRKIREVNMDDLFIIENWPPDK